MRRGLVSIIIPTKNEAANLQHLFSSLVQQTYPNFEVIINDDATTSDDTTKVIASFSRSLHIKHVYDNVSLAQGRLQGSKVAQGEYMLHIDADMELTPHVIKSCIDVINQGCNAVIIPEIGVGGGFWNSVHAFEKSLYVGDDSIESARFFQTKAYWAVGGYDPKMVFSEDKDIDLRLRAAGYKIGRTPEHIFHHEKSFSPIRSIKKKFFYGKTSPIFISAHFGHSLKQANLIFRPAFFRHWLQLVKHPILTVAMLSLKVVETFAGLLGLVSTRIPMFKIDPWEKSK